MATAGKKASKKRKAKKVRKSPPTRASKKAAAKKRAAKSKRVVKKAGKASKKVAKKVAKKSPKKAAKKVAKKPAKKSARKSTGEIREKNRAEEACRSAENGACGRGDARGRNSEGRRAAREAGSCGQAGGGCRAQHLLHHDADLLSERHTAHRPCLHRHGDRRDRALSAARRQVRCPVSDGNRRARPQDAANRCCGGPHAARTCGSQLRALPRDDDRAQHLI